VLLFLLSAALPRKVVPSIVALGLALLPSMVALRLALLPSKRLAAISMTGCTVIARFDCFVVPPRNNSRRSNLWEQGKTDFEAACGTSIIGYVCSTGLFGLMNRILTSKLYLRKDCLTC